eukprot:sb/3471113/
MRHELETDYIGVQEALFSNMDNTTLPDDIVEHIRNTEEAVISESLLLQLQTSVKLYNVTASVAGGRNKHEIICISLNDTFMDNIIVTFRYSSTNLSEKGDKQKVTSWVLLPSVCGTPGVFQRRVPNLTTSPGFRQYKMDFKYAILALKSNPFFATAYFQSGVFSIFASIFDVRTKIFEIETLNSWNLKRI